MKVLHVVCDLIRGGSEGQCARTLMGLQKQGVECKIAVFYRQGFFLETSEEICGPVYEIKIRKALSFRTIREVRALSEYIKTEGFDIIQTWDAESTVFGAPAAVLAKVPLITSRRDLGQIYPKWKNLIMRWADRRAVAVVANAEAIADHFSSQGLDRQKIKVIGNILDVDEFDRLSNSSDPDVDADHLLATVNQSKDWQPSTFNLQPSTFNFVCVSRLDPEKDHEMFLRAFALAMSTHHPSPVTDHSIKLHIIGDGNQRLSLQKLADELEISEQVHFHGERSDIPRLLQDMDIGILTPKSNEGLSNTILEYMAAGLPVVATDCGGNRELVEGADCGQIVPIGDVEACAAAIKQLIVEGNLSAIGNRGRMYIEENHRPEVILLKFKKLYDSYFS